jgi:hypothetical protein
LIISLFRTASQHRLSPAKTLLDPFIDRWRSANVPTDIFPLVGIDRFDR